LVRLHVRRNKDCDLRFLFAQSSVGRILLQGSLTSPKISSLFRIWTSCAESDMCSN
jgi:hypothetical protein